MSIYDRQPARIGVLLQRIDVGRGREELNRDQAPQLLRSLAENARIESIRASTAIEGIDVPPDRAARLASPDEPRFRNRNEREFAGYRDAIDYVVALDRRDPPTVPFALHLHREIYRHTDGRGGYMKEEDNQITRRADNGQREIVFRPVSHRETPFYVSELMNRYETAGRDQVAHPLVLLAAFILDFLAIHPVLDGNGRVARLLTAYELLRLDYGVVRHISIEQRVLESKNSYYASLERSQRNWHEGRHSIWHWTEYLLEVISEAYEDFEERIASAGTASTKQARVREHVLDRGPSEFRFRDLKAALPDVSDPTLRLVLNELRDEGLIHASGRGPSSRWIRSGEAG